MADGVGRGAGRATRDAYTRVILPSLSDRDLASHTFIIEDPRALPGLTNEEPPRDQNLYFEGRYKLNDWVKCVFGHPHKRGYVFRDEERRHYLVGKTCGENVMGMEAWEEFDRGAAELEDRSRYLRQMYAFQEALRRRRSWLTSLAGHSAIEAMAELRAILADRRSLYQAAQLAFLVREGRVDLMTQVRSIAREEARETREEAEIAHFAKLSEMEQVRYLRTKSEPKITTTKLYDDVPVDIGALEGRSLFTKTVCDRKDIRDITQGLCRLADMPEMPELFSELKKLSMSGRSLLANLVKVQEEVGQAIAFFNQDNIERVVNWANSKRFDGCTYYALPGAIRIEIDRTGKDVLVERPRNLVPIDDHVFRELTEASVAFSRLFEPQE